MIDTRSSSTRLQMCSALRRNRAASFLLSLAGITLADVVFADELRWERHAFALPESIWSVEALDVNGDDRLDLIAMGETTVFALLAPDWEVRTLADTVEPKLLYCVRLDADGDGDLDLALGRYRVPWITYREALAEGKAAKRPQGSDFSVAWIENTRSVDAAWPLHVIDRELNGIHGLCTGDFDDDGIPDLMAGSIMGPAFPRSLSWFKNPGATEQTFIRSIITRDGAGGRPHYLDFADLDGDGRGDLLVGESGDGTFSWWEPSQSADGEWTRHIIAEKPGATNIRVADVNGDGQLDLVASCGHGRGVFWFESSSWKEHVIDGELRDPHALTVGDFDADGRTDVAVASFGAEIVRWYLNGESGTFTPFDIDTGNQQQAYDLKTSDLDQDGRPDLILAGRESRNVVWYRNTPTP